MPLRFWRTVKIAPGIRLNLSKRGASVSLGPRGAHLTLGTSGARYSVGLPGTGLSYGDKLLKKGRRSGSAGAGASTRRGGAAAEVPPWQKAGAAAAARSRREVAPAAPREDLDVSFLEGLTLSGPEKSFVNGLKALREDQVEDALAQLSQATSLADGSYMAGVACLRLERHAEAIGHFQKALERSGELGSVLAKYDFDATVELPIAAEYAEDVGPDAYGAALMLAEACQAEGQLPKAEAALAAVAAELPGSPTLALSLAEIRLAQADPEGALRALTDRDGPEPLHTAIRVYRSKSQRELGLLEPALQTLAIPAREAKRLPGHLMRAVRYERALTLAALHREGDARQELEAIYAEDPGYEDVAARLGRA